MRHSRIVVLSLTHIPMDGRVQRHCRALAEAGHKVTAVGFARADGTVGALDRACATRYEALPPPDWSVWRKAGLLAAFVEAHAAGSIERKLMLARRMPGVGEMVDGLEVLLSREPGADAILANDWGALPAALMALDRRRIPFHYDAHELSSEEHAHSLRWRLLVPPLVRTIEGLGFKNARSSSTVGPGVADALAAIHGFETPPRVIMNVPDVAPLRPGPVGKPITLLYHGLFKPDRGLLQLVESTKHWPPDTRLLIRGRATDPAFSKVLGAIAAEGMRANRIAIEPMVDQSDVVTAAHKADLGVFLPDLSYRQNRLALPNKLFEYLFAGIVPIVPAHCEMSGLLRHLNAGVVLDDPSPLGLAKALPGLTPQSIAAGKDAAHRAARLLFAAAQSRTVADQLAWAFPGAQEPVDRRRGL